MRSFVMSRLRVASTALVLFSSVAPNAHGQAKGAVTIVVEQPADPGNTFRGVGFQVSAHLGDTGARMRNEVFEKRWRELAPSHALVAYTEAWDWARVVPFLKGVLAGSEIWLTSVSFAPEPTRALPDLDRTASILTRLVRKEGVTNLTAYCVNARWPGTDPSRSVAPPPDAVATFCADLSTRLKTAGLDIEIIGNVGGAPTVSLARHTTFGKPEEDFYAHMAGDLAGAVAGAGGRRVVLTSLAPTPLAAIKDGVDIADRCAYWGSEREPWIGLKLAEATIAAINAGVTAVTFMSFADLPPALARRGGQWGGFAWDPPAFPARDPYYAMGLLARHVRAPARVLSARCSSSLLRVACLQGRDTTTLLVVNRADRTLDVNLYFNPRGDVRQYTYRAEAVPRHPFADLPSCQDKRISSGKRVGHRVSFPAHSFSVVRSVPESEAPERIRFVDVSEAKSGGNLLTWDPVVDRDLCYYRIYRLNMPRYRFARKTQIGSSADTKFIDAAPPAGKKAYYAVIGVDQHGNVFE